MRIKKKTWILTFDPKEREKVLEALQAAGHHWEAEYILDL